MPEIKRHHTVTRMSQIVEYGDMIFLAGQVADDPSADATGQTQQIVDKIDRYLAEAGSDRTKLLSATIWLSDIRYFADMNSVWDAWVPEGHAPGRTCVETLLAGPQFLVEITVIAGR